MHANQAAYAQSTSAVPQIVREIPDQLQRLRDRIDELGARNDLLIARTESVRRIPVPAAPGNDVKMAAPAYAPPQTPLGLVLDAMIRDVEHQLRNVNFAIDTVELA